jgi:kynureninase
VQTLQDHQSRTEGKPLESYRHLFPILETTTFLNSNSMGAMPETAEAGLAEYARLWATEGGEAWETWLPLIDEVAAMAGRFFGAAPGEVILNQNVSFFQNQIAGALEFTPQRNKVVMSALEFPSLLYVWERARRMGADLQLVPSSDGITVATERLLAAIDERTIIVPISHAYFVSAALTDVKALVRRAHEVDAYLFLDAYQTLGVLPIDVKALDVDLLVGGSHKWLCGGPGCAFLYVKPELRERFAPMATGWFAHAEPFAFELPPIRYAERTWRFMGGTPSVAAYYVAREAYKILLEIGVERIRRHNLTLTEHLIARAREAGLSIHSPIDPNARTGFVAVDFPGAEQATRTLIAERFKLDWRPNCGIRIGPHFYNTIDEIDRFVERAAELRDSRA